MKVSDFVIDFLVKHGVSDVFLLIGGAITHLADSMYGRVDLRVRTMHHEQAAAFAADVYARTTGNIGVAMATSGPGALNLLTGIGSCFFDSVPALFITGQVNTYEYKFDSPVRQIGFQETDIVTVAKPLVKYAALVTNPSDIRFELEKALYISKQGRPGPVLLDIPMDVQRSEIQADRLRSYFESDDFRTSKDLQVKEEEIEEVVRSIQGAARPLILAGHGIRLSGATHELMSLVDITNIPVAVSLLGLDVFPHDRETFLGLIGTYGHRYSNLAIANCDLLLILGARLDTRQTGTKPETFARGAKKIHVDIDGNELNAKVKVDQPIHGDVKQFLGRLNERLQVAKIPDYSRWRRKISEYKNRYPTVFAESSATSIDPNELIEMVSERTKAGDIICLDIGQNQIWAAQSFKLKSNQRMIINGGMGSMGFSLPGAVGASYAAPQSRVIALMGDGGIQINLQEMDTIASDNLPVKIIVLNNQCLGMVRQFQDMYFAKRFQSTIVGYHCPDICRISEAFGIRSFHAGSPLEAKRALEEIFAFEGPALLNVNINQDRFINPKLLVNRPVEDMSPYLGRDELEEIMIVPPLEEEP